MDNKIPWKTCKCGSVYVGINADTNLTIQCEGCKKIKMLDAELAKVRRLLARALDEIKRLKVPITIIAPPMGDGPHTFTRDLL